MLIQCICLAILSYAKFTLDQMYGSNILSLVYCHERLLTITPETRMIDDIMMHYANQTNLTQFSVRSIWMVYFRKPLILAVLFQ